MKRGAAGSRGGDDNNPSGAGKRAKKPRGKGSVSMKVKSGDFELDLNRFPDKLRWLLDNEAAPEALWWLRGGDAIGINKKAFEEKLLEQEFRGNKFSSITRKLNRWGFRRIDDQSRVPKGSIAYSHDFFVQSAIARMRFMKKEEDRKPAAEEGDAKSSEETPGESSLRNLLGDTTQQSTGMGNTAPSAAAGLAQSPANQAGLLARILNVPGADLPPIALAQDQHQRNFLANQAGTGSQLPASVAALANSQFSEYPAATSSANLFSFQNQLTGSLYHQQQLPQGRLNQPQLLQERHHHLLVQERTQQLQRLLGASIGRQQFELSQALLHGGSRTITETGLPSLAAGRPPVVPSGTHADPRRSVAHLTQPSALDLSLSRMLAGNVAGMENASSSRAPTAFRPTDLALLNQNTDLSRLFPFQQQQNQHVGQERLLQIQRHLGAGQDSPADASLPQGRRGDARPEEKEERKEAR